MTETASSRQSWWLLIFLTLLNVLNFVDRQLIASLAPVLMQDWGLSRAEIELLFGYIFLAFYTVMGLILSNAADRWHRPRLIAAGLAPWSALTWASGAACNLLHLSLARVFVGVGEATLTPAAVSMLSDVFPPKQRAFASGFILRGRAARRRRKFIDLRLNRAALWLAQMFLCAGLAGAAHQESGERNSGSRRCANEGRARNDDKPALDG